jgi:hypothetical protein
MRNLFLAALAAVSLLSSSAIAADERNVTVVNGTGYGIKFLGFNPPGDEDWDENELSTVLRDKQSVYIKFNEADDGCRWNILITWAEENTSVRWNNVNLCQINVLTLLYDDKTEKTSYRAQ